MAARKQVRRAPSRRKQKRSWRIPKVLLFLSYGAMLIALGAIFFMKAELRRFSGFGSERDLKQAVPEKKASQDAEKQKNETQTAATQQAGEITAEEKKQLENILRSRDKE